MTQVFAINEVAVKLRRNFAGFGEVLPKSRNNR
jgi:hypothetical protein